MRNTCFFVFGGIVLLAGLVGRAAARAEESSAASLEERYRQLEQKQKILEQRLDNADARAKETILVTADPKNGFSLKSPNGAFALKFTGYAQVDYRAYVDDDAKAFGDQFLLRKVRPTLDGVLHKSVDFRIQPDFGGGTTAVQDAYVDLHYSPLARVKAGKFKFPLVLEALQNDTAGHFIERAYPSALTPSRDVGVQWSGDFTKTALTYAVGVFDGGADGTSPNGDGADNKDFVGRVFLHPFKNSYGSLLKQLGVGAAGSFGKEKGTAAAPGVASYKDTAQQTFFSYRSDVVADGKRVRFSPQMYWYPGPLGILAEYANSSQEVKRATTTITRAQLIHRAWQVAVSCVLTGESSSYKGVKPRTVFDPAKKTWGALDLVGRYTEVALDRDAFPRYAEPAKYAQRARTWTGGFNWYLNDNVKFSSDYDYTRFTGNRVPNRSVFCRLQLAY